MAFIAQMLVFPPAIEFFEFIYKKTDAYEMQSTMENTLGPKTSRLNACQSIIDLTTSLKNESMAERIDPLCLSDIKEDG